jgi:MoaA/NifB/PqqE/SkfB family radical SAM enzyme
MKIINIKPKTRQKGFDNSNFTFSDKNNENITYLLKKLGSLEKKINTLNLSIKEKDIIIKILNSYTKLQNGSKLKDDEMVLQNHELLEFEKLSEKNHARYLLYRYRYNMYPKLKIVDNFPPCVQIEPTSICNFRCVMCYQADKTFSSKSKGFMGHMKVDLFKKCIDEVEGKVEAITFASRGEPTLSAGFEEMIKYTNGKFLGLKINTNASMLNEKMIHLLLSSDIQTIVFSIDSKDKESYEKIRINGNFEKTIKNLEMFNHIRDKHYKRDDKIVRISGVKINDKQNVEDMKKKWGNIADIIAFTNYTPWESSYDNEINDINSACSELWTRMFIWWDGKANPCDYDYKSYLSKWNVKDKGISEIWNSDEYNKLRNKHLNDQRKMVEPCNRCISA